MNTDTPRMDAKTLCADVITPGTPVVFLKDARELERENARLRESLKDMLSGWKYIRQVHGDLYGVGWDRAQKKAEDALANTQINHSNDSK